MKTLFIISVIVFAGCCIGLVFAPDPYLVVWVPGMVVSGVLIIVSATIIMLNDIDKNHPNV